MRLALVVTAIAVTAVLVGCASWIAYDDSPAHGGF
jgi:hypothetical protein